MTENNPDQTLTTEDKPQQKVTIEDTGPARKLLTIELPEDRINEKIESMYTDLSDDAVIPGFRRGRAPRRLIEKRFSQSINEDAKNQLLQDAYTQAIEDNKLQVIGEPEIKNLESIELPESGDFSFQVEVEITPEVVLPSLEGIKINKKIMEVGEKNVDEEIQQYCQRMGQFVEVHNQNVQAEDFVLADVKIFPGDKFDENTEPIAHHPGTYILVNGEEKEFKGHVAGILINDLGKRLAGKKHGDIESIAMTGPGGHENELIKDQSITIQIKIEQVQRVQPAPLETLIAQMGYTTEDDLRQWLKTMLSQRYEREQQADMHSQISEYLLEQVDLELPEGLTGRQTQRVLKRQAHEMAYLGTPQDQIELKLAEARAGSEDEARKQLKLFFIIDKAATDLNIEVSQAEINGHIAMIATQQQRRPEKLRQDMQKRGELENLYLQIRELKTLNHILSKADITEMAKGKEEEKEKSETTAGKKTSSKKKSAELDETKTVTDNKTAPKKKSSTKKKKTE